MDTVEINTDRLMMKHFSVILDSNYITYGIELIFRSVACSYVALFKLFRLQLCWGEETL